MKQKKLLFINLIIITVILIGALKQTGAYFSSQAQSILNTFTTQTMRLVLSDNNQTQSTTIAQSWEGKNLIPGSIIPEQTLVIRNDSEVTADHLDITFSYTGSENLAKNIIMSSSNNGFRYGVDPTDDQSINLITNLKGGTDVDYTLYNGTTGGPIGTVDGADGSTPDNQISLSELAAYGKIRISPGAEADAIRAGSEGTLWLNAIVGENLSEQNAQIEVTITVNLDQDSSQL